MQQASPPSQQTPLGKGDGGRVAGDDEMVEHLHVDQGQGSLEGVGQLLVGPAGFSHAGGMVVGEDDGCCVVLQGQLDDLAGIDCRRAFKSTQRYALNFTQGL